MKRTLKISFRLFVLLSLSACVCFRPAEPVKSQLEIRQMQTHIYETGDFKLAMKAMLNVLQDEGFVVKNVHLDLGFLNASKEIDEESMGSRSLQIFLGTPDARWKKSRVIDVTANVSEYGEQTKVRVNFQVKIIDNIGNVMRIYQVETPEYYQAFFSKISKSIFIQEENI